MQIPHSLPSTEFNQHAWSTNFVQGRHVGCREAHKNDNISFWKFQINGGPEPAVQCVGNKGGTKMGAERGTDPNHRPRQVFMPQRKMVASNDSSDIENKTKGSHQRRVGLEKGFVHFQHGGDTYEEAFSRL